jgi:hypothetical protein
LNLFKIHNWMYLQFNWAAKIGIIAKNTQNHVKKC